MSKKLNLLELGQNLPLAAAFRNLKQQQKVIFVLSYAVESGVPAI